MKKNLIDKIMNFDANLVWEIDKPKYYGLIGWDGFNSWWLEYNLRNLINKFLSEFIFELKTKH